MKKSYNNYFLLLFAVLIISACNDKGIEISQEKEIHNHAKVGKTKHVNWDYTGEASPEHWAELSPEFIKCAEGHFQSPIDLESQKATKHEGGTLLQFNYHPAPVDIVNNGHTVQANVEADDEDLIANGHPYHLKQIHFHAPAEHQMDGIIYPMEMHMVHADDNGKLAVVGVFIKEGSENNALATLWEKLPKKVEEHVHPSQQCDVLHLLPDAHTVFHYSGSLTTPPCSEGVEWFVMKTPIELSKPQIAAFKKLYFGNNRGIQKLEARSIEIAEE